MKRQSLRLSSVETEKLNDTLNYCIFKITSRVRLAMNATNHTGNGEDDFSANRKLRTARLMSGRTLVRL